MGIRWRGNAPYILLVMQSCSCEVRDVSVFQLLSNDYIIATNIILYKGTGT